MESKIKIKVREVLFPVWSVAVVCLYLVYIGFNAEYVGASFSLFLIGCLLFVRSKYFRSYIKHLQRAKLRNNIIIENGRR